jgi:type II secretory pathway component HofQ
LITKSALSSRGTVQVDPRTNTLILTDLPDRLTLASDLIGTLDQPQPQVEIEARIVQANKNYARQLGIQWGSTAASIRNLAPPRISPSRIRSPSAVAWAPNRPAVRPPPPVQR